MKRSYIDKSFRKSSLALIDQANEIIETYQAEGYDLTLRQLYYQFVARDIIANKQTEYNRIKSLINNARLAGLVDWNAIVDRTRKYESRPHWDSPVDILRSASKGYRIDLREDQDEYLEVWVEKDALVGVIEKACNPLDVGYLSCRGFVSQSAKWRAAQRIIDQELYYETTVLYLGDHDPSGMDIVRDIQSKFKLFGSNVVVERIALNMDQIEKYQPPPNTAKQTDSRYEVYVKEYGEKCWELDALDPRVLVDLIIEEVESRTDGDLFEARVERMEEERKAIRKVADDWKGK